MLLDFLKITITGIICLVIKC